MAVKFLPWCTPKPDPEMQKVLVDLCGVAPIKFKQKWQRVHDEVIASEPTKFSEDYVKQFTTEFSGPSGLDDLDTYMKNVVRAEITMSISPTQLREEFKLMREWAVDNHYTRRQFSISKDLMTRMVRKELDDKARK